MDEDQFYAEVARELSAGELDRTTCVKAFEKSNGSNDKAKSIYITLRVEQLRRQWRESKDLELKKKRQQLEETKARTITGDNVACPRCKHIGPALKQPRGNETLCFALFFLCVLPGVLYGLCTTGYRFKCAKCGNILHEDHLKVSD